MDNTTVETNTNAKNTKTTKTDKPKVDLYQLVTDKIMALLEKGVAPWRQTWSSYGLARNYVSGKTYNGINKILMNNTIHPIPYFLSFKQAKALNGTIKKGAKGEMVFYFNVFYKDANNKTISEETAKVLKAAGQEVKKRSTLRYFKVFNVAAFSFPKTTPWLQSNSMAAGSPSIKKRKSGRPPSSALPV